MRARRTGVLRITSRRAATCGFHRWKLACAQSTHFGIGLGPTQPNQTSQQQHAMPSAVRRCQRHRLWVTARRRFRFRMSTRFELYFQQIFAATTRNPQQSQHFCACNAYIDIKADDAAYTHRSTGPGLSGIRCGYLAEYVFIHRMHREKLYC